MKGQIRVSFSIEIASQVGRFRFGRRVLSVWGATENNGGLWWQMVAVGDGECAWDVRNGFVRKKEEEMVFFLSYTNAKAENAQVINGLGHGNVAHTLYIFSKIPTVKACTIVL